MCKDKCSGGCAGKWISWILVLVGSLNWLLVGIGIFAGKNMNVVNLIVGRVSWLEAVIYLLVGIAAIGLVVGCPCKKCKGDSCGDCGDCKDGKCDERNDMAMDEAPAEMSQDN